MAFLAPMEHCPTVGYPAPPVHAHLRLRAVLVLARGAEQGLTMGRLFHYLAACRSFDRNWHLEDCSVYSSDM